MKLVRGKGHLSLNYCFLNWLQLVPGNRIYARIDFPTLRGCFSRHSSGRLSMSNIVDWPHCTDSNVHHAFSDSAWQGGKTRNSHENFKKSQEMNYILEGIKPQIEKFWELCTKMQHNCDLCVLCSLPFELLYKNRYSR